MIQPERIITLNDRNPRQGDYVLYWMQQSQRYEYNHALAYAIDRANELSLPLAVFFGITPQYPEANARHYAFMLQGLAETQRTLEGLGIGMIIQTVSPEEGALYLAERAALAVTDRGYLRIQRQWRESAARGMLCPLIQVESDVVVPVETASFKEEFSAATLRHKLKRETGRFLVPMKTGHMRRKFSLQIPSRDASEFQGIIKEIGADTSVKPVRWITGGTNHAMEMLQDFIKNKLKYYDTLRNDPSRDFLSHLSPYLHFGQISSLQIALEVLQSGHSASGSFLEELIVRRELAVNFVYFNSRYDEYGSLPQWAMKTLEKHEGDRREYLYSPEALEQAKTHDPYWNAAQRELLMKGKMHGYMRMYWGKKILEWSPSPREGYSLALYLNNKYSIDGRDPSGYAGVAWCFGKHDRPWRERPIFGTVRYMNNRGLERKFDIGAYVSAVEDSYLHWMEDI